MVYSLGRLVVTIQGGLPKWDDKRQLRQSRESSITKSGERRIVRNGMLMELSGTRKIPISDQSPVVNGTSLILKNEKKLARTGMRETKIISQKSNVFGCLNTKQWLSKLMVDVAPVVEKKKLDSLLSSIFRKMGNHIEKLEGISITTWSEITSQIRIFFQSYA